MAAVLGCSLRWAQALTKEARDRRRRERDEEIARQAAAGRSTREIAREMGVSQRTAARSSGEPKARPSQMAQQSWTPSDIPAPRPPAAPDPDVARAWNLAAEMTGAVMQFAPILDRDPAAIAAAVPHIQRPQRMAEGRDEWKAEEDARRASKIINSISAHD